LRRIRSFSTGYEFWWLLEGVKDSDS